MQFLPVKINIDAVITRADGTKETLGAISLFKKVNADENELNTNNPSQK